MITKALNEAYLWKGQIQIHQNHQSTLRMWPKPVKREPIVPSNPRMNDELNANYADYSKRYWAGVKQRAAVYREARQNLLKKNNQQ
jgi:hypothetical protein